MPRISIPRKSVARAFRGLLFAVSTLLLVGSAPLAANDEPQLQVAADSLPDSLPDWLRPELDADGLKVLRGDTLLAEFWMRTELPEQAPTGELGIEFGSLPEGALVGLVRLEAAWSDYKKQPIQPGLYTMRYGVQPADGDHTGQTWFRDFLMLLPVDRDIFQTDGAEQEPVVEASKAVSSTTHPAVIALFMVYDEPSEPGIFYNDLDQPMLAVPRGDLVLGLVIEGHGEEATL